MPSALSAHANAALELKQKFAHRAEAIAERLDGVMAYTIVDLTSGDRFAHLETAILPTASTIKLAIVYDLFKQVEEGRLRLEDTLVLDRTKAVGGTGVLADLGTPTLSIRDYAVLMVRLSDMKKSKESRLRRGLAADVETADKPGELDGVRVDAGIVFARNRPYVLAVMTAFLKDETPASLDPQRLT